MKKIKKSALKYSKIFSFFFISLILLEFPFLISTSFSSPKVSISKEQKIQLPPLSLIGVIVSKNVPSSMAILKDEEAGKIIMLTIEESILDLTLIHVFENRVILQKGKKIFQIFLGRNNLINVEKKTDQNLDEISEADRKDDLSKKIYNNNNMKKREFIRSEVEKRVKQEWPSIIKEIKVVPNIVDGKISGFRIANLPNESIISETGIEKNDVIKEINGIELKDISTLWWLYNTLKVENKFEILIERNGKLFRLSYAFK